MNWYVFSTTPEDTEDTLEVCGSYAEAVFLAQCAMIPSGGRNDRCTASICCVAVLAVADGSPQQTPCDPKALVIC